MNMNLAAPCGDVCSAPQTPYLSFHSPQRSDLLFVSGDMIELQCQAGLRSVGLRWTLHRNLVEAPFRAGAAEALPANRFAIRLDTAGLYPGFYDLKVELDTGVTNALKDALTRRPVHGVCTFGWQADQMAIAETRPADFAHFWDVAKAKLARIPLDAKEGPMESFGPQAINDYNTSNACLPPDYDPTGHRTEEVESCKVDFAGPDGGRVYGWLAKPAPHRAEGPGAGPKGSGKFPAMLVLPGAGFGARPRPLEHARHGYVALDIQVHGQEVDLKDYPKLPGYYDNPQYDPPTAFYFYNVHLRCLQAINYLLSRSDVDPTRLVVVGGSQGGRLGVVVAGLDSRVKALVSCIANAPNQPYLRWAGRCNGDVKGGAPKPALGLHPTDGMDVTGAPPVIDDLIGHGFAYYDPMNYAPDIHCPVLMNAGLIDPVSPPISVWAVYNRLGTVNKQMVALDGLGHDWSAAFDQRAWRWLDGVWNGATGGMAMAGRSALRVVCLGDSITGWSDLSHYLKFSHILERMLKARAPDVAIEVFNRGIGGDTTDGVLKRLVPDALALKPDIVVLLIGGNDANSKAADTHERFACNYETILTNLLAAHVRVLALQYHVLPNPAHPETAWVHLDDHNDLIAKIATAHGVPVLDMGAAMRAAARAQPLAELVSETDGVHLNPGGELVFADAIYAKLGKLGWLPSAGAVP